ncbi:hypothetical protein D082_02570 [Synechocystis sp. PCC 6714]|nr:hypothetical protein D082_02570 [Synechocystis sp. PCC 6714]
MGTSVFCPPPPKLGESFQPIKVQSPPELGDLKGNAQNCGFRVTRSLADQF